MDLKLSTYICINSNLDKSHVICKLYVNETISLSLFLLIMEKITKYQMKWKQTDKNGQIFKCAAAKYTPYIPLQYIHLFDLDVSKGLL